MPYDGENGKALAHYSEQLAAAMRHASARRTQDTFDMIVSLLVTLEQRDAQRVNGHHILQAAERVLKLSPAFATVNVNECVRLLEHGYASRRTIQEMHRG